MAALRTRMLVPAAYTRPLATTAARAYPRTPVRGGRFIISPTAETATPPASSTTVIDPPVDHSATPAAEPKTEATDEPSADPESPEDAPPTPSFPSIVTTLSTPARPTTPLGPEHHVLFNHLATSFLTPNQPCQPAPDADARTQGIPGMPVHGLGPVSPGQVGRGGGGKNESAGAKAVDEPVIALVTPFEGGDNYVAKAVDEVAGHLGADVVRLDLSLGVGFDGPFAPLNETGISAPPLQHTANPVFQTPPSPPPASAMEMDEGEEHTHAEDDGHMPAGVIRMPMLAMAPFGAGGTGGMGGPQRSNEPSQEDWVSFFSGIINMQLPEDAFVGEPRQRRIILLESTAAMAETFDTWWPSFLEAVRRRRRGPVTPSPRGKRPPPPTTTQPTTVVLSIPPSLLPPHTADASDPAADEELEGNKERMERIRSVAEALGASVSSVSVDGGDKGEERLWWSSDERDAAGRKRREERRLRAVLNHGADALLPFRPPGGAPSSGGQPANPILDMLMGRGKKRDDAAADASLVWKALPVIPSTRDTVGEQHERMLRRRALNAAIMMRAVGQLGATLEEPLSMLDAPGSPPCRGRKRRLARRWREPDPEWSEYIVSWREAVELATTAVGKAAVAAESATAPLVLKWADIQAARGAMLEHEEGVDHAIDQYLAPLLKPGKGKATPGQAAEEKQAPVDSVVETIKKDKGLSKHEKRLLPCIVDATKLATASFKDVHLPFKTIDGIRTVISLPLLFPDAFKGGILKDHVTSGALLFGPPGTGKTLLARAIAAESGARMLAIQPSDVNDMWVGEGEKLVKAVFSMARKLSPCVVFIDEVDSLFAARSARDSSGGSKAHNQILTEFMQEMDGLSSASSNRDKRVVVVGATNRPFDLDDAILRRLPRRLLVDLPTEADRKAILGILLRDETLAKDVELDALAKKTEGFSGSDLKHLCVSAALAAVKDMIDVPWKSGVTADAVPAESATGAAAPGGSGPAPEEVRLAVDEPKAEQHEPVRAPSVAEAEPVLGKDGKSPLFPAAAALSDAAKVIEQAYVAQLEARGRAEADAAARPEGSSSSTDGASDATATATANGAEPATTPAEPTAEPTPSPLSQRTLQKKHFDVALTEIRPSSSEEGTLPELRKWAEQYGEGGKRAGKKSGFGKGFGFGGEKEAKGFGRVDDK